MKQYNPDTDPYQDIIDLPRHISTTRKKMSLRDRSAQFSPFAAVSGYDTAIKESSRLTEERIILDENAKALLDEKLRIIQDQLNNSQEVEFIYFVPDQLKSGGQYVSLNGVLKKIDSYENHLLLMDGTIISIDDILDIKGHIFQIINE